MRVPLKRVFGQHLKHASEEAAYMACSLTINNKTICVDTHEMSVHQKNS